jgi:hypothetical protein
MKSLLTIIIIVCSLNAINGLSQSTPSLKIGLNLGVQLPNKSYAQFLNGSHPYLGVSRILNDPIIRPQLEELFGYSIIDWDYPANLRYDITLVTGGYFALNLDEDFSFIMNIDLSKAKVTEILVINLDNPQNIQGEMEFANITAQEQRFNISLGVENVFNEFGPIKLYAAGGGLVNYIKLEKQELIIRDSRRYSIMRINPGSQFQNAVVDGFGYGLFGQFGVRYGFNEKFSFDLGLTADIFKNKGYVADLVENTGYSSILAEEAARFKLNAGVYFRIIWN